MDRVDEILYLYEDDVEAPVDVLERLKATDPDKELRQKGLLPPLQQVEMADGGRSGFPKGGYVKPLDKEQQKLWNELNPDLEWKNYKGNRGNWRSDFKRKKKILDQTRGLISEEKLAEILTEELGEEISRAKIFGKYGVGQRTKFAETIDDLLFKGKFGSITSTGTGGGSVRYFKKPSKSDIKKILKSETLGDVRINALKSNTLKNVIALDKEFKEIYRSGNVPDIEDVLKLNKKMGTKMTENSAGLATARLAQIYNGHKFRNTPEGIRVNKKAADGMFEIMNNSPFGNPYRNGLYKASLQTIDTALGNKTGTFDGLKKQAKKILIENKIPIYSPEVKNSKGKVIKKAKPGFNINEIAGVTGSAKSKNVAVSQFIDIMEGNLNQKTLAQFQGQLSTARQLIEEAKGTKNYKNVLSAQSKKLNARAKKLESLYDVKLPRLADPDALKSLSTAQIKRLESQTLGTGENLYTRLVKDAERSGYSIKMPKGALTVQEFTELDNKKLLKYLTPTHQQLIKNQFCKNAKGGTPGSCPIEEAMDNMIKQTNDVKRGAVKGAEAARIASKASKVARFGTGAGLAKALGPYGIAAEALFEVAMAVPGYARGETGKRLLGDSLLGLIPGVGQSAEEEFDEYATKAGMSELEQQKIKDANRFLELNDALPSAYKNIGKGGRGDPLKGAKNFERLYNEYSPLYDQFVGGPPSESVSTVLAEQDRINQQIAEDKAERAEKRNIAGEEDFMAAGGGIAGIRRPGAIPPESGPQPQGLENLKYYVTNT